jgi:hypothetical protein
MTSVVAPSEGSKVEDDIHPERQCVWNGLVAAGVDEILDARLIVTTLDATLLARERSLASYMLRTPRPELFAELLRDQVSF